MKNYIGSVLVLTLLASCSSGSSSGSSGPTVVSGGGSTTNPFAVNSQAAVKITDVQSAAEYLVALARLNVTMKMPPTATDINSVSTTAASDTNTVTINSAGDAVLSFGSTGLSKTFPVANKTGSSTDEIMFNQEPVTDVDEGFILTKLDDGSTSSFLEYTTLGVWTEFDDRSATELPVDYQMGVTGSYTPIDTVNAKTGTASYTAQGAAILAGTNATSLGEFPSLDITGMALTADFDANTISGSGSSTIEYDDYTTFSTVTEPYGTVSYTGTITNNLISGTTTIPAKSLTSTTGTFSFGSISAPTNGGFFGPSAEEVGAVFAGSNAGGDAIIGGFAGK